MNAFQQVWQNFEASLAKNHLPEAARKNVSQLNELNQAVFKRLEKILPFNVKVRAVTAPTFIYYTEAAGGYGVDAHAGCAQTYRIAVQSGTFEERVDAAAAQLHELIVGAATVFFYMPIYPIDDEGHMFVRFAKTGETVDVEEGHQLSDRNT